MQTVFWRFGVLVAALVGGMVGAVLVFPLGLIVNELIIWPLSLAVGALFAAIGAVWMGNLLTGDRRRSNLLPVLGVSEATAAVAALVAILLWQLPALPNIYSLALGMLIVAVGAAWGAGRYRGVGHDMGRDAVLTLALLVAAVLVVVATVYVASLFGLTGA